MEAQHPEWILNLLKAHSGEPLLVQVAAEAIRRRDAELLEKVENMLDNNNCSKHWSDGCRICASNESIYEIIKLIKGE